MQAKRPKALSRRLLQALGICRVRSPAQSAAAFYNPARMGGSVNAGVHVGGAGAAQQAAGSKPTKPRHWVVSLVVGTLVGEPETLKPFYVGHENPIAQPGNICQIEFRLVQIKIGRTR